MKINMHQSDEPTFFIACGDDGVEVTCELLFTFPDPMTGNNYMVYTDNTEDQDGNTCVYASKFDPTGNSSELCPVEDERIWAIIEEALKEEQEDCDGDEKSVEELEAELEDLINELSEMFPQHKGALEAILADPESVDYAGLRDSILNDMDDCSEGS